MRGPLPIIFDVGCNVGCQYVLWGTVPKRSPAIEASADRSLFFRRAAPPHRAVNAPLDRLTRSSAPATDAR